MTNEPQRLRQTSNLETDASSANDPENEISSLQSQPSPRKSEGHQLRPQALLDAVQVILMPLKQRTQQLWQLFNVDEQEIAEILEQVRAKLPTTEVILMGKPQTGKSSIIRSLTGVSADIIGEGFRPHTTHTQSYTYPTDDLPLLIFTDTIGLGEGFLEPSVLSSELVGLLERTTEAHLQPARIIVLTVKITDFATDFLKQIITQIRSAHPEIPCLLSVTCLHELYPASAPNHPSYPPDYEDLQRAFAALQAQFASCCDRSVLVDFTLEEDGYSPIFYGLDTFIDALGDLLPAAEAQIMYQLLDQSKLGSDIGQLYREAGRRYILPFAIMAATLAAVPLPFATMPVLTVVQVTLVSLLARLYGQTLSLSQAGGVVSAIAGGFLAQMIGRELIKFVPGVGSVVAASWAGAYTWALGEGACVYFGDLMGGKKPDPKQIQRTMKAAFQQAQKRFRGSVR